MSGSLRQTRRVVEVASRVLAPAVMPTRFITTAMPKSGSNWLEAMLFSLPGIGGYGVRPERTCLLALSMVLDVPGLVEHACGAQGSGVTTAAGERSLEHVLTRLLEPRLRLGEPVSAAHARELMPRLERLAARIPPRTGLLAPVQDEHGPQELADARDVRAILMDTEPAEPTPDFAAIGCPSKHIPPVRLREFLPGYRVVQVVRDPRDVLISRFYHDLGALNPATALLLAERSADSDELRPRSDWRRAYFSQRVREMLEYYAEPEEAVAPDVAEHTIVVRYEDLLADAVGGLRVIARFLGAPFDTAEAEGVVARFRFERVVGGDDGGAQSAGERRGSFLRSGRAGDWRNYFDRGLMFGELEQGLTERFVKLLVRLGYEPDGAWVGVLPERAAKPFDFARLRPRSSLARSFRWVWEIDPALRARYADPADVRGEDCFCDHLMRCEIPEVRNHAADLRALAQAWGANVAETAYF